MNFDDMQDESAAAPPSAHPKMSFDDMPDETGKPSQSTSPDDTGWGSTLLSAVKNTPSSAGKFVEDTVQPFLHPIETGTNLVNLGRGVAEKTGLASGTEHVPYADALRDFFVNRYGSLENAKHTFATDPVGIAADLSVLMGGVGLAERAPSMVGETSRAIGTAGRAIDPLSVVAKGAKTAAGFGADIVGGLGTHTGGDSLKIAGRAGYEGGEAAKAFLENMRGQEPLENTVAEAKVALGNIRQERGSVYRDQMRGISADPTVLDFQKVDDALNNVAKVKTFKGQVISESTQDIRNRIMDKVDTWKNLDPAEFHTAEGMDALKQQIGDIRDSTAYGTPERVVANQAYHAIRSTIVDQAPQYAKIMKGYEEASKQIKEIERTLSLNDKAPIDTSLRKLQSVLRNNVNTNYGQREKLAEYLVNAGAPNLMNKLAGQALSTWTPRGLGRLGMQMMAEIAAMGVGHAAFGPAGITAGVATLPLMSPRAMGEASYYAGKAAGKLPLRTTSKTSYQIGRQQNPYIKP